MRGINLDDHRDERIATAVVMTGVEIEEMYRLLAIAKYEDRYVIPSAHADTAAKLEELGASCSLDFEGGPGMGGAGPFGSSRGSPVPVAVETFDALKDRQTSDGPSTPTGGFGSREPAELGRQRHAQRAVPALRRQPGRRRTVAPAFDATTRMDKTMYVAVAATLGSGSGALAVLQHQILGAGYDYRGSVSPWLRSILTLRPDASLMSGVPLTFQIHVVAANLMFALWPFTRLVHVFSAPLGYLTRPYVVYRSRDERLGTRSTRRGWERVERPGTRAG